MFTTALGPFSIGRIDLRAPNCEGSPGVTALFEEASHCIHVCAIDLTGCPYFIRPGKTPSIFVPAPCTSNTPCENALPFRQKLCLQLRILLCLRYNNIERNGDDAIPDRLIRTTNHGLVVRVNP